MTVRHVRLRILTLAAATTLLALAACSSDDGNVRQGHPSARAALDAHIEAARTYDLETDCDLRTPERRKEMAAFDGLDADTYCATVTKPIVAAADQETKDRSRSLYTDPTITVLDRPGGTWFSVVSADGTYAEEVETIEVDGRWWVNDVDSDLVAHDHDHDHDEPAPVDPGASEPTPSTAG